MVLQFKEARWSTNFPISDNLAMNYILHVVKKKWANIVALNLKSSLSLYTKLFFSGR